MSDDAVRITTLIGHGLKPGMAVTFSHGATAVAGIITSVTATTCVIRAMTRRERVMLWLSKVRYRAVRLWWRAWDAVADRVA
jgi:ABC-type uncharacterized transport system permease subunit